MMKKIFLAVLFSLFSCSLFAQFMEFHFLPVWNGEENMKIAYNIPPFFEEFTLPEENMPEVSPDRSFKVKFNGAEGEVHFILFSDTGVDEKNPMKELDFWNSLIMQNIAGAGRFSKMQYKEQVAKDFKADLFGLSWIMPVSSNFARNYKYAYVDSSYKKGRGICMRVFLMNDTKFAGTDLNGNADADAEFFEYYKTFSF
ncbi:MAG: hypothetical protein IJJ71_09170 [Treponema sp.]|uniref:hypothetical protein n=1 Tax=Treponema sp. TaxID=166 RepID=UPI0025FD4261|nr:hypothetical protein [Treponema sp.]MBR0496330.1 hypothetical protein [Treponema sp.]